MRVGDGWMVRDGGGDGRRWVTDQGEGEGNDATEGDN